MEAKKIPACIGIILDGNRRWAKTKGLPKLEGHRVGLETLKQTIRLLQSRGVPHVAVFMFSTENWNREAGEVSYLMDLFLGSIRKDFNELDKENVRIRFVGQRERFSSELQKAMNEAEEKTAKNTGITLWACLSYGGRAEIVEAARTMQKSGEEITEESFAKHVWTAEMPDPDIIIRTGGVKRLSNFLTWKGVYSELFFTDTNWPDFSEVELDRILQEYGERERRMGR
ncbi:MAG: undecaprenyl diphosphate synthase [Parcubacteria group bacterium Gr01-1014_56]|nr:MAG: undecaprenyl diphosphate synthase [Parcubacteria group bacterium Gr01-1014_56]